MTEFDMFTYEISELFKRFDIEMEEERIKFNAYANAKGYEGVFLKPFTLHDTFKKVKRCS